MIYDFPEISEPIRQGDIFYPIPSMAYDLDRMSVIQEDGAIEVKSWDDVDSNIESVALSLKKEWAIVASQDCDNIRSPAISFFVIKPLPEIRNPTEFQSYTPKSWMKWVTKKSMESGKLFYLPQDERIGFVDRMMVVFQNVIQVPRESIESRKNLRKGRLCEVADEHFRESIAQFFRRYPYNEWYPLVGEEFSEYQQNNTEIIQPYPWQIGNNR